LFLKPVVLCAAQTPFFNVCCVHLQVRMPEGDTVVLDDEEPFSSGGGSVSGQQFGEVVDAEFRDIK
jgi:hypothetical protein